MSCFFSCFFFAFFSTAPSRYTMIRMCTLKWRHLCKLMMMWAMWAILFETLALKKTDSVVLNQIQQHWLDQLCEFGEGLSFLTAECFGNLSLFFANPLVMLVVQKLHISFLINNILKKKKKNLFYFLEKSLHACRVQVFQKKTKKNPINFLHREIDLITWWAVPYTIKNSLYPYSVSFIVISSIWSNQIEYFCDSSQSWFVWFKA